MGFIPVRCPNCSADIQLDDTREFGFCGFCGTKIVQDKMVVEHRGSVKIDNTEFVQKFLQNARRAMDKTDWEEAEKYYNMVEQNVPDNIEALFFSAYCKLRREIYSIDTHDDLRVCDILIRSMTVISDYYDTTSENKEMVLKKIDRYINMLVVEKCCRSQTQYGISTSVMKNSLYNKIANAFLNELKQISEKHDEQYIKDLIAGVVIKQGGCYVATAVYGSYDCPEVWALRRYRDYNLAKSWYGRTFIKTYYAISPTLVKWFGDTQWFKNMWKPKLDKMVKELKENGVEDTPYEDIEW